MTHEFNLEEFRDQCLFAIQARIFVFGVGNVGRAFLDTPAGPQEFVITLCC